LIKIITHVLPEERVRLAQMEKRSPNWRVRERSLTILLLSEGMSCQEVADQVGIHPRTVGITRKAWLEEKFESLPDKERTGAPLKLTPEEQARIIEWAQAEPLNSQQLLRRHLEAKGTKVHFNTIVNLLKSVGMTWKRTRHSLKKKEMNKRFG
jgi:transposase